MAGGDLVLLLRGEEGLEFRLFLLFEREKAGFILFQRTVILLVEVFAFLPVILVDSHDLLPLFGCVMDEFVMSAAEAVLTLAMLAEAVLTRAMEGVAVTAGEGAGGARGTWGTGCAMETMGHCMGRVGCLSVRCKTQGQYSQEEEQCLAIHDFTFLCDSKIVGLGVWFNSGGDCIPVKMRCLPKFPGECPDFDYGIVLVQNQINLI